jgi:hypothetical protein
LMPFLLRHITPRPEQLLHPPGCMLFPHPPLRAHTRNWLSVWKRLVPWCELPSMNVWVPSNFC